jgi:oligopeptide transport system substrate-binding protein
MKKMKKKSLFMVSSIIATSMLFAGCGSNTNQGASQGGNTSTGSGQQSGNSGSSQGKEKVARLISGGEPGSLHPALAQGTHESIILDHVFEGLMKRDQEGHIVEGMAASYTMSADGLTYTFTLRDDAVWSNGEDVLAEDFEYAWKYALNPNTASDYAFQLYYIEGGEEFNSADIDNLSEDAFAALEEAVGVKALDDTTLEVKLVSPTPYFLELCAFYTYYPVNKSLQEENPNWALDGTTHVSNGAFTITEWNHDQSVELVKNEHYYNSDLVNLSAITFYISEDMNTEWQMYQNGEIDVNYNIPTDVLGQLREKNDPELVTDAELAVYYYNFNTTIKPLNNLKVRKALSMAIDRTTIVEEVAQGGQFPAYALVPGGVADASGDFRENGGQYFNEDVEAAKALLAEGLAEEGMDSASFTILYNTSEAHKKIAEAIQQMWAQLGVTVELENTEFQVKLDREKSLDFEISRAGWIGDYVDPNTFLDMFASWNSYNNTGWTDPAYDELITKANAEFDVATRMGYLHEAEAMLMENSPIMPIYYYTKSIATKPYLVGTTKVINRDVSLIYADIVE